MKYDEEQRDQLSVPTLHAIIVLLLTERGLRGDIFGARELRAARLRELVLVPHAGGAVSVGVGSEQ